jgi:uncharacterized protein involved in exopolysaccharide biosynthesis
MSLVSTNRRHSAMPQGGAPDAYQRREDGAVEVSQLWRILWHRRFLIAAIVGLFAAVALAYGLTTPGLYTASAQILIDPQDLQVVTNDVNPSRISPDGGITQVESQVSVVQSTGVLMRAIAATNLTQDPEFNGQGLLSRLLGSASAEGDRSVQTLDALRRRLAVKRADKVLVLDVIVTAKSADKAALLANAIAQAYLVDQASARALRPGRLRVDHRAAGRAAQARPAGRECRRGLQVRQQHGDGGRQSGQRPGTDRDLNTQLSAAQSRTAALKAQVDQMRRVRAARRTQLRKPCARR